MHPALVHAFTDELTKVGIAIERFNPLIDDVWRAIVKGTKGVPGSHPTWRQVNRLRMQGLSPITSLEPINRRWLRDVQAVAPKDMLSRRVKLVGGAEGGVRLPMIGLEPSGKGIIPVSTIATSGEREIGTFFHPEMIRQHSKYVDFLSGQKGGSLSPRQIQSIQSKMKDVDKRYATELRSALKEMSPGEWDNFLKSYRGWERTHRGKEPAWTSEARRRLVEMGELHAHKGRAHKGRKPPKKKKGRGLKPKLYGGLGPFPS